MPDLPHFTFQGRIAVACGDVDVSLPVLPSLPKNELNKWQNILQQKILVGQVRKVRLRGWVKLNHPAPALRVKGGREFDDQ
jgi:hypothetical protein